MLRFPCAAMSCGIFKFVNWTNMQAQELMKSIEKSIPFEFSVCCSFNSFQCYLVEILALKEMSDVCQNYVLFEQFSSQSVVVIIELPHIYIYIYIYVNTKVDCISSTLTYSRQCFGLSAYCHKTLQSTSGHCVVNLSQDRSVLHCFSWKCLLSYKVAIKIAVKLCQI